MNCVCAREMCVIQALSESASSANADDDALLQAALEASLKAEKTSASAVQPQSKKVTPDEVRAARSRFLDRLEKCRKEEEDQK